MEDLSESKPAQEEEKEPEHIGFDNEPDEAPVTNGGNGFENGITDTAMAEPTPSETPAKQE